MRRLREAKKKYYVYVFGQYVYISICVINILSYLIAIYILLLKFAISAILPWLFLEAQSLELESK